MSFAINAPSTFPIEALLTRSLAPIMAAFLLLILLAAIVAPRLQAQPGQAVAAVFAPWKSRDEVFAAVARSGAEILRTGPLHNVVLISTERSAVLAELYRAGAWSLLNAQGWGGCVASEAPATSPEGR